MKATTVRPTTAPMIGQNQEELVLQAAQDASDPAVRVAAINALVHSSDHFLLEAVAGFFVLGFRLNDGDHKIAAIAQKVVGTLLLFAEGF